MWTSAWQSHRYGDGCGVSVLGLGGAVFTLSQHAFASDREWGRQRRREENAQMSTKAKVTAAGEHILSFARRNHVPDDTWSAACRLYVIGPPRALSHTGTSAMILLYMLWTLYVQIHRCSLRQILNSVPFPVPRVTFVSSLHTKVVVPCPAVFIAPPPPSLKNDLLPMLLTYQVWEKCFHDVLTSWAVCAYTSCSVGIYVFCSEKP